MHIIKWMTILIFLMEDKFSYTTAATNNERWQELTPTSTVHILDNVYEVVYNKDVESVPKPRCMKLFMDGIYVYNDKNSFWFNYNRNTYTPAYNMICKNDVELQWRNDLSFSIINQTQLKIRKYEHEEDTGTRSKAYETGILRRKVLFATGNKKTRMMFIIFQNEDKSNDMGKLYAYNFITDAFRNDAIPSYYLKLFGDKVLTVDIDMRTGNIAVAIDRGFNWRLIVMKYIKSNTEEFFPSLASRFSSESEKYSDSIFQPIKNKILNQAKVFLDYYVSHAMRCEKLWSMLAVNNTATEPKYITDKAAEIENSLKNIRAILDNIDNLYSKQKMSCPSKN